MRWTPRTRYAIAVLAGLAAAGGLLAVVGLVNARYPGVGGRAGGAICTGFAPFGWLAPLLIVGVVVASGWLLMSSIGSGSRDNSAADERVCPGCGEHVLGGWRLCPYCGRSMSNDDAGAGSVPPPTVG